MNRRSTIQSKFSFSIDKSFIPCDLFLCEFDFIQRISFIPRRLECQNYTNRDTEVETNLLRHPSSCTNNCLNVVRLARSELFGETVKLDLRKFRECIMKLMPSLRRWPNFWLGIRWNPLFPEPCNFRESRNNWPR